MKKVFRISGTVLAVVLILLIGSFVAAQSPAVQTFIGKRAVAMLRDHIDGDIQFEKIQIKPFEAIVLKNVVILDRTPYVSELHEPLDTFAKAGYITARFSLRGLFTREGVYIHRAAISDGVFNLATEATDDGGQTTNLARIFRLSPDTDKEKKSYEPANLLQARALELRNFSFRMVNYPALAQQEKAIEPGVMNFACLHVYEADIAVKELKILEDGISARLEKVHARERSGLHLKELSCQMNYADGVARFRDFRLRDDFSHMQLQPVSIKLPPDAIDNVFHKVTLDATFASSVLDMRTLAFIVPEFRENPFRAQLNGRISGSLDQLRFRDLRFRDLASGVEGLVEGEISGLPVPEHLGFDLQATDFLFRMDELDPFLEGWAPGASLPFEQLAPGEPFCFNGTVQGPLGGLHITGDIQSEIGSIDADLQLDHIMHPQLPVTLAGEIRTENLDIGRLTGNKDVRELTAATRLRCRLLPAGPEIQVDTIRIDRLRAKGYEYRHIGGSGSYDGISASGRLFADDPKLQFALALHAVLPGEERDGIYRLTADVRQADLHALHLDERDSSVVSFRAVSELRSRAGTPLLDGLEGQFDIRELLLTNSKGAHRVGDISLRADCEEGSRIRLASDFADASLNGSRGFSRIAEDFQNLTLRRELDHLVGETAPAWDGADYDLQLRLHDSRALLAFVLPGAYLADSTDIRLKVTPEGLLDGRLRSSRLALGDKYLRHVDLALDNRNDRLQTSLTTSEIRLGALKIRGNSLSATADDNRIRLHYGFDNDSEKANKCRIDAEADILRDEAGRVSVFGSLLPSAFWYEGAQWQLNASQLAYSQGEMGIGLLSARCGDQSLELRGGFSPTRADTLSVALDRFELGIVNSLIGDSFGLTGLATGSARVISPARGMPGLLVSVDCENVQAGGKQAGDMHLTSTWNEERGAFELALLSRLAGEDILAADGFIRPATGEVDVAARLNGFNPGVASRILSTLFTDIDGRVYGTVRVGGSFQDLRISSEDTRFADTRMTLGFTNVTYFVDGPFHIDNSGAYFDEVGIRDRFDGTGTIGGGILFNGFQDMRLDVLVRMNRIEGLNLSASDSEAFYGQAFGSGTVRINGPLDRINLIIDITTTKEGTFHLPLGGRTLATHNLLSFTQPVQEHDPYEAMLQAVAGTAKRDAELNIQLRVNATPLVKAFVELGATGQAVGRGRGRIDISVKGGDFAIGGNYTLSEGNFHLNVMDLASRDFAIEDGSSIRFNGDVMRSDLGINGVYRTKAPLSRLVASSMESGGEAFDAIRQVECGIHISDRLSAPKVEFSIRIPDLDPTTQHIVESELNSQDKIQKQFVALLLTNNFLPTEQSGIVNTESSAVFQGLTSIMAGQINKIFQRYEIPVDVKMNYQSTATGYDAFDVAVSTQLFNNRVIVNGNIGNRRSLFGQQSDVVGDIDIQFKLNRPGNLRLNVFSHSADAYTNYLDYSQRNGAGISYQQGFNTLGQLVRRITSRRRRQASSLPTLPPPAPRVSIAIDSTGHIIPPDSHDSFQR